MLQKVCKLLEPLVARAYSHVWHWYLLFGCKKQFFPSASIRSEFILTLLLWEDIYICKRKDYFWNDIKVGKDSFHHTQFGPKASQTISQTKFFLPKRVQRFFLRNDPLQQDWVEIARFRFCGSLFSASSSFYFFIFLRNFSASVWYWFLLFGCKKQFCPSASIWSEFILTLLLWEGIYICKRKIISEMI